MSLPVWTDEVVYPVARGLRVPGEVRLGVLHPQAHLAMGRSVARSVVRSVVNGKVSMKVGSKVGSINIEVSISA